MKSLRKNTVEAAEAGKADEAQATLKELASAVDRAQEIGPLPTRTRLPI